MSRFSPEELAEIEPGPIAWMAAHPVAGNLLMLVFLLGGYFLYTQTTKQIFPVFTLDSITVTMGYPGASPAEVEQGITLALETAVRDVDGVGEITSRASEGMANLTAEVVDPDDVMRILQDINTAVDRITTFPVEAEDLTIAITSRRIEVLELALYGDVDDHTLRAAADLLTSQLEANPAIGPVELAGVRDMEIHIEVSQANLRRYGLSLPQIASKIRVIALELGGGSLKTGGGEILVRMSERRDTAAQFRNVPVITLANGSQVLLGDIARISEGFEDNNTGARFNNKPAVMINVFRIGEQTPSSVAQAAYAELDQLGSLLPAELQIGIVDDDSVLFEQRAEMLVRNGLWGLLLVVVFLALFLDFRLAFWVSMGIPISFMGAFLLFPMTDFNINVVSMFALIIAIGIVVIINAIPSDDVNYLQL